MSKAMVADSPTQLSGLSNAEILESAYRLMAPSSWYRAELKIYRLRNYPDRYVVWKSPQDTKYDYQRTIEFETAKRAAVEEKDLPPISIMESLLGMLEDAIVVWNLPDPVTNQLLEPPSKDPTSLGRLPSRIVQELINQFMLEVNQRDEIPLDSENS